MEGIKACPDVYQVFGIGQLAQALLHVLYPRPQNAHIPYLGHPPYKFRHAVYALLYIVQKYFQLPDQLQFRYFHYASSDFLLGLFQRAAQFFRQFLNSMIDCFQVYRADFFCHSLEAMLQYIHLFLQRIDLFGFCQLGNLFFYALQAVFEAFKISQLVFKLGNVLHADGSGKLGLHLLQHRQGILDVRNLFFECRQLLLQPHY